MTVELVFYSPLSAEELEDVVVGCIAELEAYRAEHPTLTDVTGTLSLGGTVPSLAEAKAAHAEYEEPFGDSLAKKLERIQSVATISDPGDLENSPLQVSMARYLVDRIDDGLALLIDYPLLTVGDCIEELQGYKARDDFEPPEDDGPDPLAALFGGARSKKAKPKKSRPEKLLDMLERARADTELALDAQSALKRVSEAARAYGAALFEFGAIDDATAAIKLGVPEDAVIEAAEELSAALSAVFDA